MFICYELAFYPYTLPAPRPYLRTCARVSWVRVEPRRLGDADTDLLLTLTPSLCGELRPGGLRSGEGGASGFRLGVGEGLGLELGLG